MPGYRALYSYLNKSSCCEIYLLFLLLVIVVAVIFSFIMFLSCAIVVIIILHKTENHTMLNLIIVALFFNLSVSGFNYS